MGNWIPQAERILEVGCGEGAMTERITRRYPNASITAIDITSRVGRLYRGDPSNVTFSQEYVEQVACRKPAYFDLIVVVDILHHVPVGDRSSLLAAINQAMAPNGSLIVKDWIISSTPIHWLCNSSERYLTGDDVAYLTIGSINTLLTDAFGRDTVRKTEFVRPWKNNWAALVQPQNQPVTTTFESNL